MSEATGNKSPNKLRHLIYSVALRPLFVLLGISYANQDHAEFQSKCTPEQIMKQLSANIEQFPVGFSLAGNYVGEIKDTTFQVRWHEALRRNSHTPVLCGNVEKTATGSKIVTHFDIPLITKVFFVLWWIFITALWIAFKSPVMLIPFIIANFVLIQVGVAFGASDKEKLLQLIALIAVHDPPKT